LKGLKLLHETRVATDPEVLISVVAAI